jgi:hypothetical protein
MQVKQKYWMSTLAIVLSLVGCTTTQPHRAGTPAVFRACVHPDLSKQFSYRKGRPLQREQVVMMQRMAAERGMAGRSYVSYQGSYGKNAGEGPLYEELAELMATGQFCKEGYFELDSSFEPGYERIIGECNDSATSEEMAKLTLCGPEDRL